MQLRVQIRIWLNAEVKKITKKHIYIGRKWKIINYREY